MHFPQNIASEEAKQNEIKRIKKSKQNNKKHGK